MCEGGYECAICLEGEGDSTAPLKLACSHSFCAACLRSHALAQLKQQGRYLAPCPLCKREMRMKEVACVFASADPKSRSEFVALLRKVQGGGLWQEEETATEPGTVGQRVTRDCTRPCCRQHSPGLASLLPGPAHPIITIRPGPFSAHAGSCAAAVVFEAILERPSRGPSRLERSGGGPSRSR